VLAQQIWQHQLSLFWAQLWTYALEVNGYKLGTDTHHLVVGRARNAMEEIGQAL